MCDAQPASLIQTGETVFSLIGSCSAHVWQGYIWVHVSGSRWLWQGERLTINQGSLFYTLG